MKRVSPYVFGRPFNKKEKEAINSVVKERWCNGNPWEKKSLLRKIIDWIKGHPK